MSLISNFKRVTHPWHCSFYLLSYGYCHDIQSDSILTVHICKILQNKIAIDFFMIYPLLVILFWTPSSRMFSHPHFNLTLLIQLVPFSHLYYRIVYTILSWKPQWSLSNYFISMSIPNEHSSLKVQSQYSQIRENMGYLSFRACITSFWMILDSSIYLWFS